MEGASSEENIGVLLQNWSVLSEGSNTTSITVNNNCSEAIRFAINTILAGSICCLGFLGNTASFIILSKDKEAPTAAFLLKTLACVDNFFLSVWFLHFSLSDSFTYLQLQDQFHVTWLYVRVYTYPLLFVGQTATIWMIVLIAVSRYIAVCKPYKALHYCTLPMAHKAVWVVLLFSLLYNLPRYFETKIVQVELDNKTSRETLERTEFGDTRVYGILYFDSLYYIFSFVLPLASLVFMNTSLTIAYRRVQGRRNSMNMRSGRQEQNITLVMIVVIMVFILCNAPARVVQIIWGYKPQTCLTVEFLLIEISNVLEVLNSSVNFIVYCVFRSQFRSMIQHSFCSTRQSVTAGFPGGVPVERPADTLVSTQLAVYTAATSEDRDTVGQRLSWSREHTV